MRFRLVQTGEDSLKEYLRKRFVLIELAEEIGVSNQSLHPILNGQRNRPKPEHLEAIAEKAGLILGFDSQGPYFDEALTEEQKDKEQVRLSPPMQLIYEKLKEMNEEDRVQWQNTFKFLLGIKE